MTTIGSDSDFRDSFLEGAARAFFTMAYAAYVKEGHSTDNDLTDDQRQTHLDLPRPGAGEDWCDYAPEPPANAYALAGELWGALHAANGEAGVYSLSLRAEAADGCAPDAEKFGHYLAMQSMGEGVSWFDDHKTFPVVVPHVECSQYSFSSEVFEG